MQARISVAYIHHATCLPASSLQTTIVSNRYEKPYHCQLMIKLSRSHGVIQWRCAFFVGGGYVFSDESKMVHTHIAILWLVCRWSKSQTFIGSLLSVAVPSLFGLGATVCCVNPPQHRPRNVRLCCCLSPSIILGHCQREREMTSTSLGGNRGHVRDYI